MDRDDLLLMMFCLIDDQCKALPVGRLRRRGPMPALADSEVLTIEVMGELLGLDQDRAIYRHFRTHHRREFPALGRLSRTTFVRQAANLWALKLMLHRRLWPVAAGPDPVWLVDSFPLQVCRFARAKRCRLFAGVASFGYDPVARQTCYGLRVHLCATDTGVVAGLTVTAAHVPDIDAAFELAPPQGGLAIGDRAYWRPAQQKELRAHGLRLLAPYYKKSADPNPRASRVLIKIRRLIETVISQWTERWHAQRLRARDCWHLTSRIARKLLSHTTAVILNQALHQPHLQFAHLLNE